ncbi:MAG: polysaccharide deacetylase family protein [Candidatus Latescibacteria bacterium]|nr:polysaccharide deacetylase family protein [Candidatus Latescibacterota bacterium]NIM21489.1 polysaccharide deacetylase family protein [Candidatus Latescibacterota bacterium]NIM65660.1 polysaccharide deacetylase family protein [Candidatus Latescibacterota bacterium]NIO02042.1 polysaccharide deacetylase family protein [Candidatus Latescibacterota bacterium]NIO28854.1 polysaccharide deacetylase family protein [Candidatus Latescibacterota bacterium]
MKKRHLLGGLLNVIPFGLNRQFRKMRFGEYLTVLCYHRILDRPANFPYDDDLVSASADQFAGQLDFISKHYNVINFKDLRLRLDGEGALPGNSLIITFDDGYIDNYEIAWPLLKMRGLTATMFVTTGFIGRSRMFWWDEIAYIIKTTRADHLELENPVQVSLALGSRESRQEPARILIKKAKLLTDDAKETLIDELSEKLNVAIDESEHRLTMTWEQLRELDESGIEIGAHSVNHPIFSNIEEERLRTEIAHSKEMIENELGGEIITFGAPGRGILSPQERARFEKLLRKIVTECGYRFSTQYRWGLVYARDFDAYRIGRLGIESYDTKTSFKAKLSYPEIISY